MTRAVLDTNVLVAAAIRPGGVAAQCLLEWGHGRFDLVVSPLLLAELGSVLGRAGFRAYLTLEHAQRFVDALARDAELVEDPHHLERLSRDPQDDYLIPLARRASALVLVTGDADLLELELPGLAIVPPRQFLDLLPYSPL